MVTVRVPATSANLGPGFDTLGLALDLFLEVKVIPVPTSTIVDFCGYGKDSVGETPEDNLVLKALYRVYREAGVEPPGVEMQVNNRIPVGKGLGSSAAAIVAGVYAGNYLLGQRFSEQRLINLAAEMEGHADNVVPAVVGGLTTAMNYNNKIYYQKVEIPDNIKIIVVVPEFILPTEKSRSVLPQKVELKDMVANLQRACYLVASIYHGDFSCISMAMDDMIYQPLRKQFIPGFDLVIKKAKEAGAAGVALSGAGPSIIAFASENESIIGQAMVKAFSLHEVRSQVFYLKANTSGVDIIA